MKVRVLDPPAVKTLNNGSKLRYRCSNLYRCDRRVPPVRLIKVRASKSNFRPVIGRFFCARHPPKSHGCSRGRRRSAAEAQKIPVHEMCRRNGFLKHERRSFGIWGPGCLQNILNFVCIQNVGYETPAVGYREPLRRHVCGWLGLAGASRRESGSGWVSCRHHGLRAVRNQRSKRTTAGVS